MIDVRRIYQQMQQKIVENFSPVMDLDTTHARRKYNKWNNINIFEENKNESL